MHVCLLHFDLINVAFRNSFVHSIFSWYNIGMSSLAKTNPHLNNPDRLAQIVAKSTYESSVFEGASPRSLSKIKSAAFPRPKASSRKQVKSE